MDGKGIREKEEKELRVRKLQRKLRKKIQGEDTKKITPH